MKNHIYGKGLVIVLIIALIVTASVGIKLKNKEEDIVYNSLNEEDILEGIIIGNNIDGIKEENQIIIIDIDGAVEHPGVYECLQGERVNDAIIKAGGLLENAYTKNINKARKLVDGEKIYVLVEGEDISDIALLNESIYNTGTFNSNDKVNINYASKEQLMTLDGIGDTYAARIIEYREKNKFKSIEEIKKIKGIGDKTFENIKDKIIVE